MFRRVIPDELYAYSLAVLVISALMQVEPETDRIWAVSPFVLFFSNKIYGLIGENFRVLTREYRLIVLRTLTQRVMLSRSIDDHLLGYKVLNTSLIVLFIDIVELKIITQQVNITLSPKLRQVVQFEVLVLFLLLRFKPALRTFVEHITLVKSQVLQSLRSSSLQKDPLRWGG